MNNNDFDDNYIPRHSNNYNITIDNTLNYNSNNINNDDVLNDIMEERKSIIVKKRKPKLWVWIVILSMLMAIIVFCLFKVFSWKLDNNKTEDIINDINNNVNIIEREDDSDTEIIGNDKEEVTSDYWYYIKFPLIDVDITKLKEKNKDTIGWINVNNTNINYPYVQTTDNSYYLNHSFDKSYNEAGWVFLDYRNNSNLDNKNTILYAHSRLDKTMFGSLSKTLKSSWYSNKDNHIIRISTETENTLWQIFSVYKIPEESYYITTNFNSDDEYSTFLNTIKERSIYNFNTNLDINDKILTLSTCYSDTERTVVHAKLIKRSNKTN